MRRLVAVGLLVAATASAQISNIDKFLDQCPQNDPMYPRLRADFQIRRAGVIAQEPQCTEPVSKMPVPFYTDELLILQALRVLYYMDRGKWGHLPWTNGTLYDWMTSRIGGIDIVQGNSFCCEMFGYTPPPVPPPTFPPTPPPPSPPIPPRYMFIGVSAHAAYDLELGKSWRAIAANIALFAHETRHTEVRGHTSCCGIDGGCDQTFDPAALTPYGVQWWLHKLWLEGTINVGMQCMPVAEWQDTAKWMLLDLNEQYASRFCDVKPARMTMPQVPGGRCSDGQRVRSVGHR